MYDDDEDNNVDVPSDVEPDDDEFDKQIQKLVCLFSKIYGFL